MPGMRHGLSRNHLKRGDGQALIRCCLRCRSFRDRGARRRRHGRDGGQRAGQNIADSAALAAVQELEGVMDPMCDSFCRAAAGDAAGDAWLSTST